MAEEVQFFQHGNTTVLDHSIRVAEKSLKIAEKLHLKVNVESMIRGALLHDYFLYDWHDRSVRPRFHGFRHPALALRNAVRDFHLNAIERNIIIRHMFPLTIIPPLFIESWIVCIADKYSALEETRIFRRLSSFVLGRTA